LTSEQLETARAERMRQNGHGALTLEDARTWIEETGLCLFLPRRQYSASLAPSFVEAVAGQQDSTPDTAKIALAEELLVRLERDGVAVRLNLIGHPGEQPDYVVAAWVLPYVYALRGDRDWRRSPQLTGSRQVSPLAIQAYKRLEAGDATIAELTRFLGREVSETAVLRAITELWQQLRIIPVISAPGNPAQWQLLRHRYQKAIAEGASTSQVTAISVLASIYLQAVIAASMEEVEIFLSPLTARSKIREVLRGLVATRQVHTLTLGHAPHYYVAGTLPEFAPVPSIYASSSISSAGYFARFGDHEESAHEPVEAKPEVTVHESNAPLAPVEAHANGSSNGNSNGHKPAANGKPAASRAHFSRPVPHSRNRKPSQPSANARTARRPADARNGATRSANGTRPAANGTRPPANGARPATNPRWTASSSKPSNGAHSNGNGHSTNGTATGNRSGQSSVAAWTKRNGSAVAGSPAGSGRASSLTRSSSAPRKDARKDARSARGGRTPALTAGTKAGNSKRYGFTARPKQGTKKRG
jgi:23S rRNA pseudouridine2605 synthase